MKITVLATYEGIYEDEHNLHGMIVNTRPLEGGGNRTIIEDGRNGMIYVIKRGGCQPCTLVA
jgi:hypothetical protein